MRSSGKLFNLMRFTGFGVLGLALLAGAWTLIPPARAGASDEPGWLGVYLQELNSEIRDAMDLKRNVSGALVTRVVNGSPADQAGIRDGDVITEFDEERVRDVDDLMQAVRDREAGDKVLVVVHRDGKNRGISVVLAPREDRQSRGRISKEVRDHFTEDGDPRRAPRAGVLNDRKDEGGQRSWTDDEGRVHRWKSKDGDVLVELHKKGKKGKHSKMHAPRVLKRSIRSGGFLGVQTMALRDQLAAYFEVSRGALITEVVEDSPAESAGLRAGDVILEVDGRDVETPADIRRLVTRLQPEDDLELTFQRKGSRQTVTVTLADRKDFSSVPDGSQDRRVLALPFGELHALEGLELPDLEHLELPDLSKFEIHGLEDIELPELDWIPEIEIHGDVDEEDLERLHEELQNLRFNLRDLKDRIRSEIRPKAREIRSVRDRIRDRLKDVRPLRVAEPRSGVI